MARPQVESLHIGWKSKDRGNTPKWMVKIMENPIQMDDLGVPLFSETSISTFPAFPLSLLMSKGRMEMILHTMVDNAKLILVLYPQIKGSQLKVKHPVGCQKPGTLCRAFFCRFFGGDFCFWSCYQVRYGVIFLESCREYGNWTIPQ